MYVSLVKGRRLTALNGGTPDAGVPGERDPNISRGSIRSNFFGEGDAGVSGSLSHRGHRRLPPGRRAAPTVFTVLTAG